ncbi:hypothetical protein [Paraburkholderia sp. BCC1885]|uniref:hypothetical protein n=1 Tax=Paraburkholderia sp. BCC1885 TaxID=2562669 RepID=UPI0011845DEC|nr:hypothetical protein [Paraburkholderia sp. BCC1885]
MKYLLAAIFAACLTAASTAVLAATPDAGNASQQPCDSGYVNGVGGSAQSIREYMALPDRDKYRYVTDNPIQCQVGDDGRATGCTGLTNLQHEKASVYDDSDSATTTVATRVELDHGEVHAVIIVVPKQDFKCGE